MPGLSNTSQNPNRIKGFDSFISLARVFVSQWEIDLKCLLPQQYAFRRALEKKRKGDAVLLSFFDEKTLDGMLDK